MTRHRHEDFLAADAIRPELSGYQDRITKEGSDALVIDEQDLLIEAPTGAGKTCMLSVLANDTIEKREQIGQKGKVLLLTHRRNLHRQMAGDPTHKDLKKRLGEVAFWSGRRPGTIAETAYGGVDQSADIVVAMVETASNLRDLSAYTDVFIDETHHASEEAASREVVGAYAQVINRCENARVVGVTATTFRGDDDRLHPRLEEAKKFVVGIEETRAEGRTVPAKTYVSKARLENGMTPSELYEAQLAGKLDASASSIMKQSKGSSYYDACLDEWENVSGRGKTIVFVDDVNEIKKVQALMNEKFGEGTAIGIYGEQTEKENAAALKSYESGERPVLVACKMIGEGTDVADTDNILSFNSSITRGDMLQFFGRAARSAEGKSFGNFIDCGTGTARHGKIEEQHRIQSVRALTFSNDLKDLGSSLKRSAPEVDPENGWRVVPGRKRSLFFRQEKGGFQAFEIENDTMKGEGRRVAAGSDAGRKFRRLADIDGLARIPLRKMAAIVGDHIQREAGYIARNGGLRGEGYRRDALRNLKSWKENLDEAAEAPPEDSVAKQRSSKIRAAIRGDTGYQVGFKAAVQSVDRMKDPKKAFAESLQVAGAAIDEYSKSPTAPISSKEQMSQISKTILEQDVTQLPALTRDAFGALVSGVLEEICEGSQSKRIQTVASGVGALIGRSGQRLNYAQKSSNEQHE